MRRIAFTFVAAAALVGVAAWVAPAPGQADGKGAPTAAPAVAFELPPDYRDWGLISVAHEEGSLNDLRAILGNEVAVKAAREGTLPYPDGAIVARLAWDYSPLPESERAFGRHQSYVAGVPKNGIQFMIKDSAKYPSTGGWGYAQFNDGKPVEGSALDACYSCHKVVEDRDFVFNHYAR